MIARVGKKNKDRDRGRGSGFKYKKRTADQVKKRADQTGGNFDSPVRSGFDMWRPKSGENVIRILPPTWDDYEHYGYDVFMHRFIGSDSSNYICLNKMKGKRCPACEEAKELKDGGEDEEAKRMSFQKRCWVWIIDRDDKTMTPQVWDMSWAQDRDIAAMSNFKSGKVLLIDHPDDGYDVIVKKTGSGKTNTRYTISIDRDSSPISDDDEKQEEILNFIQENPIPTVLNFFSAEHLSKKLEGTSEEKDKDLDDDEEDERRTRKAGKRRRDDDDEDEDEDETPRRKKRRSDDDDEDEDDKPKKRRKKSDDDDEDEEEEETPRRRRKKDEDDDEDESPKRKRRKSDDDDEDEDEDERPKKRRKSKDDDDDEDEEEEDEKPSKRKKRKSDDDEDEDEDEDEKPAKKKGGKSKRRSRDEDEDEDEDDDD